MPRPLDRSVSRPSCPQGHAGRVWLAGFYARGSLFERPRFRCVPDAGKRHLFVEPLARRHVVAANPQGQACPHCDHVPDRIEGPQTPWRFTYSVREAASALNHLAHGSSLREAGFRARRQAERTTTNRYGQAQTSRHGQLAADLVSLFGGSITAQMLPTAWPDAIVIDALPLQIRATSATGAPYQGSKIGLIVMGAYGYPTGQNPGELWKLGISGGLDRVEWESFLRSLPGAPSWVVCDANPAIKLAVRTVWPQATIYACEAHLRKIALEKLNADGHYAGSRLSTLANQAFATPAGWAAFRAELAASKAPATTSWASKKDPFMARQFSIYQKGRPRSTGGIESTLERIKQSVGTRHYNFRNRARVQALLDLMAIRLRDDASEARFAEIIRRSPAVRARRKADRRALDDAGGSSILAMIAAVDARLGAIRQAKAAAYRKFYRKHLAKTPQPLVANTTP